MTDGKVASTRATTAIIGACGEHYVSAYLSGFQLIVALPRAGVPGCDLLVSSKFRGTPIRMQVKTGTEPRSSTKPWGQIYRWSTSCVPRTTDSSLWHAFVALNGWPRTKAVVKKWPQTDGPEVFFLPDSFVVERMAGETAASWSYFWLNIEEAEKFRGYEGLKPILAALKVS